MNNSPAGRQPPSFKTNVNRAKTKRWVEAKSYSYDGDDWGEVDDYDEYGGYDEPPAPSRPTGLRQQGQSATQAPPGSYNSRQDVYQSPVDNRQQGYRNVSGPASAQPQYGGEGDFHRSQSFNRGDERRAFSAGGAQQGTAAQGNGPPSQPQLSETQPHATRFSQIEGVNQSHPIPSSSDYSPGQHYPFQPGSPRPPLQVQSRLSMDDTSRYIDQAYSAGGNYKGASYSDQPGRTSVGSRTHSMTSNISSQDFHNRRDFTPSALPPPLQMRGSPSPQSAGEPQTSVRRPPRKDSLSQHGPSNPPNISQPTFIPSQTDRGDDTPPRQRADSNTSKPLPFVRPADIYKRMQEEKEKERQSQESSRPSMDVIMGQDATPVFAYADHSGMDSLSRGSLRRSSSEALNDGDSTQRLKPTLDPVKERKSEYGFEGFSVDDLVQGSQELPSVSINDEKVTSASQPSHQATSKPMLPDVTRMSGFGESFLDTLQPEESQPTITGDLTPQLSPETPKPEGYNSDLQHQPSLGFRSIVHQAFDASDDHIPPTPSSTADSTVGRSASGGTSVVSPINISRMPSAAAPTGDTSEAIARPTTPTLADVQSGHDNPNSLSSDPLGTPRQITGNAVPSQSNRPSSTESKTAHFKSGHRRDLSTPSPDNSPARTPTLDSTLHLRQPQEVELATATPIEPNFPISRSVQDVEEGPSRQPDPLPDTTAPSSATEPLEQQSQQQSIVTNPPILPPNTSQRSRPDSPGSNRVRDLAEKFESRSSSPHESEGSLHQHGTTSAPPTQNEGSIESRPAADRMESFRPRLPGGWDSFASNAPSVAPKRLEPLALREPRGEDIVPDTSGNIHPDSTPAASQNSVGGNRTATPKPDDESAPLSDVPNAISDPFTAMAAAGTALAGAFAAAVGVESEDSTELNSKGLPAGNRPEDAPKDLQIMSQPVTIAANTEFNPDASTPLPTFIDNEQASSVAPTPLPKDSPQAQDEKLENPDYFPPIVPLRPRTVSHINHNETAAGYQRPPMPPTLSTDTGSQFESDRLRREIVKNLDPALSSEPTTAESESPWQDDSRLSANPSLIRQGHDSGVLPSEYDSYWNGSSTASSSRTNSAPDHIGAAVAVQRHDGAALIGVTSPLNVGSDRRTQQPEETNESKVLPERPGIPHRFSWEQSQENVTGALEQNPREDVALHAPTNQPSPLAHYKPGDLVELPDGRGINNSTFASGVESLQGLRGADRDGPSPSIEAQRSDTTLGADTRNIFDKAPEGVSDISTPERTSPIHSPNLSEGLEVAGPGSVLPQVDRHVPQYPNQIEHQEPGISQQGIPQISVLPNHLTTTRSGRDGDLPPLPPPGDQPKLRGFREMLALKTPTDRIQAFNETREQFAYLNTGLAHWLDLKTRELPEHAHLLSNQARFAPGALGHKSSPSRSKILGLRASGSPSNQQPYYQQYLNANSQPAAPDGSPVSNHQSSASLQGFSPSGVVNGKLSSQQVQAKGKDLLHTAGVFGGKANVAAKGLFSKGKSKFKGSGSTDKTSSSTPDPEPISQGLQPQYQPQSTSNSSTPSHRIPADSRIQSPPDPPQLHLEPQRPLSLFQPSGTYDPTPYDTRALPQIPVVPFLNIEGPNQQQYEDRPRHLAEGNDESTPLSYGISIKPHNPSVHLKEERESSQPEQSIVPSDPEPTGNAAQRSSREETTNELYHRSSVGLGSPQFLDGSNKTPTKANFTRSEQNHDVSDSAATQGDEPRYYGPVPSVRPKSAVSAADLALETGNLQGIPFAPTQLCQPLRNQGGADVSSNHTDERTSNRSRALNESGESDVTFHTAAPHAAPSSMQPLSQPSTPEIRPTAAAVFHQPAPRPFSFMENTPSQSERHSMRNSQRAPSIDSVPSGMHPDRPPSPVSPQRSVVQETSAQRGRTRPTHHGTDHDFLPDNSEMFVPKRRSRSFSRLFRSSDRESLPSDEKNAPKRRSRSISRLFKNPDLSEHPAFRQDGLSAGGTDMPMHYYPDQISREDAIIPRQQATEYQLKGVGPPPVQPTNARSQSRTNSKESSSFFNTSGSPGKGSPVRKAGQEGQSIASPVALPPVSQKKSKRTSLLRSLTGQKSHDRDHGKPNVMQPTSEFGGEWSQQSKQVTSRDTGNVILRGEPRQNHNKLQRSSTSGLQQHGQDSGKKKRFSAMGSLFGRSNEGRRQSTIQSASSRVPSQELQSSPHPQPYSPDNSQLSAPTSQPREYYRPGQDYVEPPPGGYYAPGRVDPRDLQDFVARESPSSHRSPQAFQPVQPTLLPTRAPEPPAYVQDATLRQRIASPSQNTSPPKSRTSSGTPQRSSNNIGPNAQKSTFFNRNKSHDSSGHRSIDRQSSISSSTQPIPPPTRQPETPTSFGTQPHLPTQPNQSYQQPRLETLSRPSGAESPPPPPPPPKDEWRHSSPQHMRNVSGVSNLTSHTRSVSGFSTQALPQQRISHSRSPSGFSQHPPPSAHQHSHTPSASYLAQPGSPSPRRMSADMRQSLPPLQTNVTSTPPLPNQTNSPKTTSAEARKKRQQELEMGGFDGAADARETGSGNAGVMGAGKEGGKGAAAESDEKIVMSPTSYPGQEWTPGGYAGGWEHY